MKTWKWLFILATVVLCGRAVLPMAIESYVNKQLTQLESYTGAVDDVDLALFRGAYRIEGLRIEKRNGVVPTPFLTAPTIELGIDWSALWHREFVGDVRAWNPVLTFVDGRTAAEDQSGAGTDWIERIDALIPIKINSFDVENGAIRLYRTSDEDKTNPLLSLNSATLHARNFTNVRESAEPVFATVTLDGQVQDGGQFHLFATLDPLSDPPVMDLDAEVVDLPLPGLNPLLDSYANLDAEAGGVAIFLEFASKEGRFEGYVKPLVRDAEILQPEEEGSVLDRLWEGLAEVVTKILESPETNRAGAQIPLKGELTAIDAELIPAVFSILRNAFVQALSVGIGDVIGLEDIGLPKQDAADDDDE